MSDPVLMSESELDAHTEILLPKDAPALDGNGWAFAGGKESINSFLSRVPPSRSKVAWVAAAHQGRDALVAKYYETMSHAKEEEKSWSGRGRAGMDGIEEAWERVPDESKSLDALHRLLRWHKYGCGKWMVFCPASRVDVVWKMVVTALWGGQRGHSAKCSGSKASDGTGREPSHVICVYLDPFWDKGEVGRVLRGLRRGAGVSESLCFKADGVTLLGIYKNNHWHIPVSFYTAERGSEVPRLAGKNSGRGGEGDGGSVCRYGASCMYLAKGQCRFSHTQEEREKAKNGAGSRAVPARNQWRGEAARIPKAHNVSSNRGMNNFFALLEKN